MDASYLVLATFSRLPTSKQPGSPTVLRLSSLHLKVRPAHCVLVHLSEGLLLETPGSRLCSRKSDSTRRGLSVRVRTTRRTSCSGVASNSNTDKQHTNRVSNGKQTSPELPSRVYVGGLHVASIMTLGATPVLGPSVGQACCVSVCTHTCAAPALNRVTETVSENKSLYTRVTRGPAPHPKNDSVRPTGLGGGVCLIIPHVQTRDTHQWHLNISKPAIPHVDARFQMEQSDRSQTQTEVTV